MKSLIIIGDRHVNLAHILQFQWTWSDDARAAAGLPVCAVKLIDLDRGGPTTVTDPDLAMMIWVWCCDHEVPGSDNEHTE